MNLWAQYRIRRCAIAFVLMCICNCFISQSHSDELATGFEAQCHNDGSPIVLNVAWGRETFRFLVDTGSGYTILDSGTFEPRLKSFNGNSGREKEGLEGVLQLQNPGTLLVGGVLPIRSKALYHADLSRITSGIGERIHGILGCDFLNDVVVTVNVDVEQLRISRESQDVKGTCVPFKRDWHRRPVIDAASEDLFINRVAARFMIDTGAIGHPIVLHRSLFQDLLERGHLKVDGKASATRIDREISVRFGELKRFQLWGTASNIRIHETILDEHSLVGLSYLMQFNFTIDFPNSRLYLRPRETKIDLLHLKNHSGMGITREEGEVVVSEIAPQSPAARAGLQENDIVTSIDGITARNFRLIPLRRLFCEDGKTIQLGVKRASKEWKVDLVLRDWRMPVTEKDFE